MGRPNLASTSAVPAHHGSLSSSNVTLPGGGEHDTAQACRIEKGVAKRELRTARKAEQVHRLPVIAILAGEALQHPCEHPLVVDAGLVQELVAMAGAVAGQIGREMRGEDGEVASLCQGHESVAGFQPVPVAAMHRDEQRTARFSGARTMPCEAEPGIRKQDGLSDAGFQRRVRHS
jgi:hypothetical protein